VSGRHAFPRRGVQQVPVVHAALRTLPQGPLESTLKLLHRFGCDHLGRKSVVAVCQAKQRALEHIGGLESTLCVQLSRVQRTPASESFSVKAVLHSSFGRKEFL